MSFVREMIIAIPIIIIISILASQLVLVPTGSMSPTINIGDMVLVEKTDVLGLFHELNPDDIKVGDIVVYHANSTKSSGDAIIHRVIAVKETGGNKSYILKGDDNPVADPANVYPSQIIGKAVISGGTPVIIHKIGSLILYFKGNQTFI